MDGELALAVPETAALDDLIPASSPDAGAAAGVVRSARLEVGYAGETVEDGPADEALVPDARAHLSPAQMVERKLMAMCKNTSLPLSQMRSAATRHSSRRPW